MKTNPTCERKFPSKQPIRSILELPLAACETFRICVVWSGGFFALPFSPENDPNEMTLLERQGGLPGSNEAAASILLPRRNADRSI
jgi:hypothetical protein